MSKFKSYIIGLTIFLVPLFFIPLTHEFYNINKFMLIVVSTISLLLASFFQFLRTKQLIWSKSSLRLLLPMSIFFMTVAISTMIASTNKVQASLNLTYSPLVLAVFMVFCWYVSREDEENTINLMVGFGGMCMSVITIILLFHPFESADLPRTFQFLKNLSFSPIGTRADLIIYLGFVFLHQLQHGLKLRNQTRKIDRFAVVGVFLATIALVGLLSNSATKSSASNLVDTAPHNITIKSAAKSLSTPSWFLIGAGVNNFSTVFTQSKDGNYNSTPKWAVSSYDNASMAVLHLVTETGMLSLLALVWLFVTAFKLAQDKGSKSQLAYFLVVFLMAPSSLMLFFLLYCTFGIVATKSNHNQKKILKFSEKKSLFLVGFIFGSTLITLLLLFLFALVPSYRAEVAMRSSVEAIAKNDLRDLYNYQYNAVILNPHIERYRVNFSQTNLFLAKQMAASSNPNQTIVTSSVQQAINEAQAAIALNPKKAGNWENLGIIYKNVLGVKGAEQWAIAAFQRAIILDPQNVSYRLELGGIFYSLKQYGNAVKTFQEATLLKPDLPNAHYNLAHAYFQSQNPTAAVKTMDTLLALLKKQSSPNYAKVLKERDNFASGTPQNQAPTVIQ